MDSRRSIQFLLVVLFVGTGALPSQRGRQEREPSEVRERWGNYFTDVRLNTGTQGAFVKDFAKTKFVQAAIAAGHMSVLYFYDSAVGQKREAFEQTLFNHNKINPGLRLFRCGRVDMARHRQAPKNLVPVTPMFVVFTKRGRRVNTVLFKNHRVVPANLVRVLKAATKGYNKPGWDNWVRSYDKFVRDTRNMLAHQKILDGKRQRVGSRTDSSAKTTLAKVEVDERKLQKRMEEHFAREEKLLERAKVPARDPRAVLVGEKKRRRR